MELPISFENFYLGFVFFLLFIYSLFFDRNDVIEEDSNGELERTNDEDVPSTFTRIEPQWSEPPKTIFELREEDKTSPKGLDAAVQEIRKKYDDDEAGKTIDVPDVQSISAGSNTIEVKQQVPPQSQPVISDSDLESQVNDGELFQSDKSNAEQDIDGTMPDMSVPQTNKINHKQAMATQAVLLENLSNQLNSLKSGEDDGDEDDDDQIESGLNDLSMDKLKAISDQVVNSSTDDVDDSFDELDDIGDELKADVDESNDDEVDGYNDLFSELDEFASELEAGMKDSGQEKPVEQVEKFQGVDSDDVGESLMDELSADTKVVHEDDATGRAKLVVRASRDDDAFAGEVDFTIDAPPQTEEKLFDGSKDVEAALEEQQALLPADSEDEILTLLNQDSSDEQSSNLGEQASEVVQQEDVSEENKIEQTVDDEGTAKFANDEVLIDQKESPKTVYQEGNESNVSEKNASKFDSDATDPDMTEDVKSARKLLDKENALDSTDYDLDVSEIRETVEKGDIL